MADATIRGRSELRWRKVRTIPKLSVVLGAVLVDVAAIIGVLTAVEVALAGTLVVTAMGRWLRFWTIWN